MKARRLIALVCIFAFLNSLAVAATHKLAFLRPLKPFPVGLYELMSGKLDTPLSNQTALDQANIDGIRLKADWLDMEPTPGNYDFANLDNAIAQVHTKGKKCGVFVNGGSGCPLWIYNSPYNVQPYVLIDTGNDAGKTIPVPGDAMFIARFTAFIAALGAHIDGNPDVLYVGLGGIGNHGEWNIAGGTQDSINLGTPQGIENWKFQAKTIIDAYRKAFPTTCLQAALDKPFAGSSGDSAMVEVANYGVSTCGKQFILGFSALNAVSQNATQVRVTYIQSLWKGQHTMAQFGLSGGGTQGVPTSEGVDQGLRTAALMHYRFIEVYKPDCIDSTIQNYTAPNGSTWNGTNVAGTPAGLTPRRTDILAIPPVATGVITAGLAGVGNQYQIHIPRP